MTHDAADERVTAPLPRSLRSLPPVLHLQAAVRAVAIFAAVRAVVFAAALVSSHAQGRPGLSAIERWDAQWYAGIARNGYGFVRHLRDGRTLSDYAFFPLFPSLERLVSWCTDTSVLTAGLVISVVASLTAAGGIFAVAREIIGERAATIATIAWALVPIGFVETMAYTEALFTALAAWALYATHTRRYRAAAVLSCLAGLTRPLGIAVAAAVIVAVILDRRSLSRAASIVPVVLAPLGAAAYLLWVGYRQGSLFGYFHVADAWGNTFDGGDGFARWTIDRFTGSSPYLGVALLLGLALLVLVTSRCIVARYPMPVIVYTCVIVALALTTSGYFGSRPRYLLPAFPLLFPLATWLAGQSRPRRVLAFALALASAIVSACLYLRGSGPP